MESSSWKTKTVDNCLKAPTTTSKLDVKRRKCRPWRIVFCNVFCGRAMVFFRPFTRSDVQPLFDWNTAHAKRSFTKQCKISFGRKKMIGNRFILITNRAFYSSSPFSKCSFVLLQITEWKQKYCETRTDWRSHICQFEKSLLKRNQFLTGHTNAAISLQRWFWLHESLSRSQWDSEIGERERENP